jgi:hypothetical protein
MLVLGGSGIVGGAGGATGGEPEEEVDDEPVELDADSAGRDGGGWAETSAVSPRVTTTVIASLFPGGMMRAKS